MKINTVIEATYKGFEYRVKHLSLEGREALRIISNTQWFTGYVKIPKEHPLHGKFYWDIEGIDCHGGLTYSEVQEDGYWIGFDCNHLFDTPENENANFAERECLEIIDQLVKMAKEKKDEI